MDIANLATAWLRSRNNGKAIHWPLFYSLIKTDKNLSKIRRYRDLLPTEI